MIPPTRVYDKQSMSYGRGWSLSVGAGQVMTNERVCVSVCLSVCLSVFIQSLAMLHNQFKGYTPFSTSQSINHFIFV